MPSAKKAKARVISVKKVSTPAKRASIKMPAKKPKPAVRPAVKKKAARESDVSLGRPLVTQEEKLYMLFHDDYHARQIFEFLRVETVKELEQFSPQQIVRIVSKPVFDTVDRVRQKLAEMKRSLRDDEEFAAEYCQQFKRK